MNGKLVIILLCITITISLVISVDNYFKIQRNEQITAQMTEHTRYLTEYTTKTDIMLEKLISNLDSKQTIQRDIMLDFLSEQVKIRDKLTKMTELIGEYNE